MGPSNLPFLVELYLNIALVYAVTIMTSYIYLAYLSVKELKAYSKKNSFENYEVLLSSEYAPYLYIIAPAYNEGFTIDRECEVTPISELQSL